MDTAYDIDEELRRNQPIGSVPEGIGASLDDLPEVSTAGPPPPAPEQAPAGLDSLPDAPQSATELLARVKGGQIDRPSVDMAFGPPPTPPPEPPGASQGLDWKDIASRLDRARSQGHDRRMNNMLLTAGTLGGGFHPVDDEASQVAAAQEPVNLARAKQGMEIQQAQEDDRKAGLVRQTAADKLREEMMRAGWADKAQARADKSKADEARTKELSDKAQMDAEQRAMAGDRADQDESRKARESADRMALEKQKFDWATLHPKGLGGGTKVKAAADKAAKAETNVATAVDGIFNGTMDPDELGTKSNEFKQDFDTAMQDKHPGFSIAKAKQLFKQLNEYADAKPGSAGDQVQAAKVAAQHLDMMESQFKKLDNSDSRGLNDLRNRFASQLGYSDAAQALGAMKAGMVTTGSELAKTYNDLSQHGHESFETILDPNTPPKVAAEQFAIIREQMAVRMKQREDSLRRYAQSPGHHMLVDELGLANHGQPGGSQSTPEKDEPMSFKNKKTGNVIRRKPSQVKMADDAADWEASGG